MMNFFRIKSKKKRSYKKFIHDEFIFRDKDKVFIREFIILKEGIWCSIEMA
ncbi:hypothetical protein C900_03777 [Fulvivirga imtechensis AK7]|uniref:Uncharacterized protein n=1 Tax=Fulvivirga imtechensis AK7 TaxID=1237149 RepID=L8JQD9_9BACT|nr:hypothetical protein C900_03777 [Fulvivirga imtechensis AK7]